MTNLLERAETRRETFYGLTNSADVPDVPSTSGRNLIIKSQIQNGYIDNTGNLASSNSQFTTGFIDATDNKQFTITAPKFDNGFSCFRLIKYDADKNFLGRDIISYTQDTKTIKVITLADDVSYFKVSFDGAYEEPFKIERGNAATPYSQAPEDLGWSTDTLVPTQSQRYLWKFEYVYYSDGSVEITQPTNISIAGVNGQTSHVHFAFADNATGGGFSLTTPKAYMGWYADFNETASNDPTKYKWGKWKGDQGVRGDKGDDGKTSYLHLAFASSADGKTGFSFTESGQQYQGYYTDFTQTSSTDPTKYTWMDRRASVKVGGRNLLLYTADPWKAPSDYYQFNGVTKTDETLNGSVVYKTHTAWASLRSNWGKQLIDRKNVKVGDEFTYSIYAKTDQSSMKVRLFDRFSGQSGADALTGEIALTNEWQKLSVTFKVTQKMVASQSKLSWVGFEQVKNSEDGKFVYYACNMLEEGNTPTPWSPALEDTQEQIDSKADQALTQQQLEALEAKRQQMIVEIEAKATIEQISELQGYLNKVKQDDEEGRQKIAATATAIEERVRNIEPILTYSQKMQFIDTYITQGNGGMIIGANDSTTKVVVTPDRISFQDGGSEVAYISQSVLHIDNGVFTLSLQLGHFITRAHPKNQYVNATYFVK